MDSVGTYPRWQNKKQVKITSKEEAANFQYKYVIHDKKSKKNNWEKGVNRSIDLTDYFDKGMDVVVEDLFFNAGGCPPKIYEQKKSDKDEKNKDES